MLNNEQFINKAIAIHGNKYDYSYSDYKNCRIKIKINCKTHGIFLQSPNGHLSGQGCYYCGKLTSSNKQKSSIQKFIILARMVHSDKYDYSKSIYINNSTKLEINCKIHGIFMQTPNNHLTGHECPSCGHNNKILKLKKSAYKFVIDCQKIHAKKYDYSKSIYINNSTKIKIICKIHGIFLQTPAHHLTGEGCPNCSNYSKGEEKISNILKNINVKFIREYRFIDCRNKNPLPFDFYLPDYNSCIEYDGEHHFKPVKNWGGLPTFIEIQKRDKIKQIYCINNKIKLLRLNNVSDMGEKINKFINVNRKFNHDKILFRFYHLNLSISPISQ